MAWTAEKVKAMRESNPSKAAESSGWTAEKVRAIRTKTPNPSTASSTVPPKSNIYADALQQYTERHASDMGEVDARNDTSLAGRVSTGKKPLSQAAPAATEKALDMGQKWGAPAKSGNVLENVGSGAMAYGTGRAQELRARFAKDSVPDEFDRINQWLDTGDNKNLADAVRRVDNAGIYTDADLIEKGGWTQAQIDEARKMNAALDAIPAWQRGVRRTANTIGGIGDTVAAAPVLGAEYGVQAGKNIAATMENWEKVRQEIKGDEHAQSLFDLLTDVDMDYNPTWPESRNRELISMGYNSKEIREMRQKLAGLEVSDGIDKNQSVGYQLYDRGQQLTAAAQSGLSPTQRAVSGAVTSAAENLAVAGVNPAAVLPVLSAQGAAEAMGQSAEKGEGAGKALGGGLAKFGAGWAINSVGAADLAKTMGSDYAKDTLAGQIADWVQGLAGSSELAQRYPAVAAAISGGIDNSMQAFAETYADMAIDAALGDSEAAKNLFSKDTFLTALESGLSGGASGALGGAVGTGLAKLNGGDASLLGQAKYHDRMDRMERAAAQQKEWEARAAEPSQSASPTAPPEGRATGVPGSSELDAGSAAGREMAGLATEGSGSGPAQQTLGAATREQSAFLKGNSTESMQRAEATAAKSENSAVRQFAEVAASDSLTGKTIGLFTPNAENRENRVAFEQAYGVTLPDTAGATRRMLREIAAQQKAKSEAVPAVQSAELPNEAVSAPQTVQDAPTESADAMPETAAPDNVREATAAVGETDSYENAPLRETLGLRPEAPKTQREAEVQRALEGWRVTDKAAETISKNMPDRVDADRYAAAASPLYRLGRSGAATFAQALELAGSMSGTAADINYILSTDAGRTALEIAYTQGKGERMLYAEKMTELGGALGSESTSGRGEVYAKGTMRQESDPASQIISLNAAATGTDAVLRDVLQNDRSIRAYVDTETARIFFGDDAQDIFGTVLHEDYHWYNALDAEGARTLQEHALEYLAKSSGYESLDEMVRAKLEDYSAQSLTYEQAAEELVADAWRGIFDSEESFKRWVTFQRGQAEKNAGKSGAIHKVMEQVRQMLDGLISRAKEVLTIDPDNRAALKAKRLAEAEKRTLQDEYFAHAEKAMDNLRTAKENAAALKTESAAEKQGVRFSILKDKTGESYIKMEDFFGRYTTNLINETSMKLLGYDRATVKNYYPIAVDRSTLATEIEGVKMDATIEGRGFLKERVKSDKPILLEECQNVVKRSLRDTAAYAGLAAPIRDVQRVLNSTVETAEGIGVLKDKIIGEKWGKETVSYINDLLTDLQTRQRHRSSTMSRALDRMRGNYAGAILTVNPGVAIAQAASLPTAGAVLGADTMAAVLPFVKNFSGKQRAALEAEIRQHGDALLQYRLRGTKRGEMSSIGAHKNLVAKASEAMPAVTGWITGMDEITVAALWEGSKRYVEHHATEFGEGAAEKGSEAYWEAVNKMYQRVIEETQPNYTTMQRAGIQRSDNEFVKTLTMFTTQRFQNYGILADAVGDYKAQKARYAADQSAENKAEVQRAGQSLRRAAASQVVQTAVFALMKIGADFLLHRWDKEQDENGDITAASVGKRFFDLYTESAAGNFLYGAEIYSVISNAASGADYDVVSATNISAVNDLFAAFTKTVKLLRTDTGEMSEEELTAHHQKLNKAVLKDIQCGLELYGVPAANIRKVMQAFEGYWEDAQAIGGGEGFSFNSAPSSATGQYDRLYNAIQSGDSEEAAAAMKKLEQMNKTDKVDSELARRLKQYDADVLAAAEARNAGKARAEEKARKAVFEKLREGLDVAPVTDRAKGKTDAARRAQLIDLVNKAVDSKADELLTGGKDGSIYDALLDEVKNGRVEDAQEELDRLMTAGKDKGSIKSKITESVKEEYLAGSDRDREKLEKKLLALEDAEGKPLYEEKNFAQWVSAADKKAEKAKDEKNWWEGVK